MAKPDPADLSSLLSSRQERKQRQSKKEITSTSSQGNEPPRVVHGGNPQDHTRKGSISEVTSEILAPRSELVQAHKPLSVGERNIENASITPKVGRPPGRRSNPNISSHTLLIDDDVMLEVKTKLLKLNKGKSPKMTISEVVESLLQQWLETT